MPDGTFGNASFVRLSLAFVALNLLDMVKGIGRGVSSSQSKAKDGLKLTVWRRLRFSHFVLKVGHVATVGTDALLDGDGWSELGRVHHETFHQSGSLSWVLLVVVVLMKLLFGPDSLVADVQALPEGLTGLFQGLLFRHLTPYVRVGASLEEATSAGGNGVDDLLGNNLLFLLFRRQVLGLVVGHDPAEIFVANVRVGKATAAAQDVIGLDGVLHSVAAAGAAAAGSSFNRDTHGTVAVFDGCLSKVLFFVDADVKR